MTRPMLNLEPIPPAVQAIVDLFDEEFVDVAFPDVDAARLTEQAATVQAHADALRSAHEAMEAARLEMEAAREELTQKAQRALAYAQVFASGDERLSEKVSNLAPLSKKGRGAKPKAKRAASKSVVAAVEVEAAKAEAEPTENVAPSKPARRRKKAESSTLHLAIELDEDIAAAHA